VSEVSSRFFDCPRDWTVTVWPAPFTDSDGISNIRIFTREYCPTLLNQRGKCCAGHGWPQRSSRALHEEGLLGRYAPARSPARPGKSKLPSPAGPSGLIRRSARDATCVRIARWRQSVAEASASRPNFATSPRCVNCWFQRRSSPRGHPQDRPGDKGRRRRLLNIMEHFAEHRHSMRYAERCRARSRHDLRAPRPGASRPSAKRGASQRGRLRLSSLRSLLDVGGFKVDV
jgi:hypothetical protein